MEYRVHWGIVFSDVVVRSAAALRQYCDLSPTLKPDEQFEATLTLSIAQTILATTKELHIALARQAPDDAEAMSKDLTSIFEHVQLEESTWLAGAQGHGFALREDLMGGDILGHMRNSVSHPVPGLRENLPMSGYATVPRDGRIWGYRFTHSPWVQRIKDVDRPIVKAPTTGRRDAYDPDHRLETVRINGKTLLVLPGASEEYYPLMRLLVKAKDLHDICQAIAMRFEGWQARLSPDVHPTPQTIQMALATPLPMIRE